MKSTEEVAREMLRMANDGENPHIRPAVILNYNLNPMKIAECTTCYVNDAWAPKMKELLDHDWMLFRMQTEFGINGHSTVAYFAKLKPE